VAKEKKKFHHFLCQEMNTSGIPSVNQGCNNAVCSLACYTAQVLCQMSIEHDNQQGNTEVLEGS
jgi:hypothetical protein